MTIPARAPIAQLSGDGRRVTLKDGAWSETFDIGLLPNRIAFYASMRDRQAIKDHHGRTYDWRACYGPTVDALKRVQKLSAVMEGRK